MKRHALFLGGLLLALALPGQAETPQPVPAKIKLEVLKTKHLAVQVKLNGKGPYRLIFDTGAPFTLISTRAARESGMLPKDTKAPTFALFGALGQFPIQTLEVGSAKVEKMPAMVMDHPAISALARMLDRDLDGIVGFPFFARFTMTLDLQAQELTLVPNGYEPADILQTLMATLVGSKTVEPRVLAPAAQWGFSADKAEKDEGEGVKITTVWPGSAAETAGLKVGDRLLALNGCWTESVLDCAYAVQAVQPGTAVPARLLRNGKEQKLTLRPRAGW